MKGAKITMGYEIKVYAWEDAMCLVQILAAAGYTVKVASSEKIKTLPSYIITYKMDGAEWSEI